MKPKFNIKEFIKSKNNTKIIIAIAFVGIVLIAFSDFLFQNQAEEKEIITETHSDYALELEEKISDIVSAITSEEEPEVLVTLVGSQQYVYATDKNEKLDQDDQNSTQKESEESYIMVKNSDGSQQALLITEFEPKVQGVVVVSKYAGNITLKESIVNAVTTALNLPSSSVCVVTKN